VLIYIHGFNSAPASFKARLIGARMHALGREQEYFVPALPHRPAEAMALLCDLLDKHSIAALIGSSLGGFYATYLAERYGARAVLVNPAVKPYKLLRNYLGPQKNLFTGAEYELTVQHVTELEALETTAITPERYLLLTRTAIFFHAVAVIQHFVAGARQHVIAGGDHGFDDFENYLDETLAFCGVLPAV
jgi:predicted esterase YcpF (UPF0227 family)